MLQDTCHAVLHTHEHTYNKTRNPMEVPWRLQCSAGIVGIVHTWYRPLQVPWDEAVDDAVEVWLEQLGM